METRYIRNTVMAVLLGLLAPSSSYSQGQEPEPISQEQEPEPISPAQEPEPTILEQESDRIEARNSAILALDGFIEEYADDAERASFIESNAIPIGEVELNESPSEIREEQVPVVLGIDSADYQRVFLHLRSDTLRFLWHYKILSGYGSSELIGPLEELRTAVSGSNTFSGCVEQSDWIRCLELSTGVILDRGHSFTSLRTSLEQRLLQDSIQDSCPELFEESEVESARQLSAPIIKQIVVNSFNWPEIVAYESEEAYRAEHGEGSGGHHNPYTNEIVFYPRPLIDLLEAYPHEMGHAILPIGEITVLMGGEISDYLVSLRDRLAGFGEVNGEFIGILEEGQAQLSTIVERRQEWSAALTMATIEDEINFNTPVEEAGAYLFSHLVIPQVIRTNFPECAEEAIRFLDLNNYYLNDPTHFGAYLVAEILLNAHDGNLRQVFLYLDRLDSASASRISSLAYDVNAAFGILVQSSEERAEREALNAAQILLVERAEEEAAASYSDGSKKSIIFGIDSLIEGRIPELIESIRNYDAFIESHEVLPAQILEHE